MGKKEEMSDTPNTQVIAKRGKCFLFTIVVPLLTIGALFFLNACSSEINVAGTMVDRNATELDLRNFGINDAEPLVGLKKIHNLATLDLRENPLDKTTFDAIQSLIPDCSIRWSIPLGSGRYDSESDMLAVPDFSQADIDLLQYFPLLTLLDASGCTNFAALISVQTAYPDITVIWNITVAGKDFINSDEAIVCAAETTAEDVASLLAALHNLKSIDLRNTVLVMHDVAAFMREYPNVQLLTNEYLLDELFDSTSTSLKLANAATFDVSVLCKQLANFPNLADLDLRELPVEESDIATLNASYPALHIRWMAPILDGLSVDSDTESLDLRGYTVSDLASLKEKLQWLTKLTYLDMCNCGPEDAEMAELRSELPQVKVVWMLHVGYWDIRTDIRGFSMAQAGEHEGVNFTKKGDEIRRYRWVDNEEIAKLRYCTDIEALDLGHSYLITDISFLRDIPTLRFLVISLSQISDISPVSALKNLIFLEIFALELTDISVVSNLPQLEYFNCSANLITDATPLLSLTNLKRLWIIKCGFSDETLHALKVGLPNTLVIASGTHPTDTGWRFDNPAYLEMQDLFGLEPQNRGATAGYLLPENQIP